MASTSVPHHPRHITLGDKLAALDLLRHRLDFDDIAYYSAVFDAIRRDLKAYGQLSGSIVQVQSNGRPESAAPDGH